MKKITAVLMTVVLVFMYAALGAVGVIADDVPEFYITQSTENVAVGDYVDVVVSGRNLAGLATAELWVEINPYRLDFVNYEIAEDVADESGLIVMSHDPNESEDIRYDKDGVTPISGIPVYFVHARSVSEEMDEMDIAILHFKAIGGGDCRLEFLANSVEVCIDGNEIEPVAVDAKYADIVVPIEGELASEWDYDVSVPVDVTVPDLNQGKKGKTIIIVIVIVVLVAVAAFALVMAIRQGGIKEDEETKPKNN
jgi:uncharacterized membrane protein